MDELLDFNFGDLIEDYNHFVNPNLNDDLFNYNSDGYKVIHSLNIINFNYFHVYLIINSLIDGEMLCYN